MEIGSIVRRRPGGKYLWPQVQSAFRHKKAHKRATFTAAVDISHQAWSLGAVVFDIHLRLVVYIGYLARQRCRN
jgi:hypothetical protein